MADRFRSIFCLRLLPLAAVTLAGGCVQGPDYVKPEVAVPDSYRFAAPPAATAALAGDTTWWNQFEDPYLDDLVGEALANNRDLMIASARVDEYAAILAGTRSQGLPQVGYALSAGASRSSQAVIPSFVDPTSARYSSILSASWEIDLWGRIRRETEAARANLLATEEARRGVTLTIISSVVASYINLLDLDQQLRVTRATIAGREHSVALFEERLEAGWISEFEMSQVRAEYEAAVAQQPSLLQAIATQENALSVLVGRNPGPIARAPALDALAAPVVPAGLPSDLLIRRPDIQQAEQQLIASNALIGAARALFFPRINLTGLLGLISPSLGNLFTGNAGTWSYTGDVVGPIYTGGGVQAAVDQAEARRDQSFANYELVIQNAFRDVEDSLSDLQTSGEFRDTVQRRVLILRRSVQLATTRYENGYADYIDVLDAERSLFSAELQLAAAEGDHDRALVNLYRALGGDWTGAAPLAEATGG